MATTYDYRLKEVGQAFGSVVNTASQSVGLTGLTLGVDYEIQVRLIETTASSDVYQTPWGSATFQTAAAGVFVDLGLITPSVTLGSIGINPPVVVNLGLIEPSVALNAVEPWMPPSGATYELKVEHVEGATTDTINTGANTSYGLTGLVLGDTYNVSVRIVHYAGGVPYYSVWSAVASFVPAAAAQVIELGLIEPSVTVNPVSGAGDVVVSLGLIEPSITLPDIGWLPSVSVDLGLITTSVTLGDIAQSIVDGTTYTLRLEAAASSDITITDITSTTYAVTGLVENETYTASVRKYVVKGGVEYVGVWSASSVFVATTTQGLPDVVVNLGLINISGPTVLDMAVFDSGFIIETLEFVNDYGTPFRVSGTASAEIAVMTITIDGVEMGVSFDGTTWSAILAEDTITIHHVDWEFEEPQIVQAGNQVLEIN
jgi:hypothetical protein